MTKSKRPSNKYERVQIEKNKRAKETGNKAGRIRKTKFIQEKEEENDFSTLGYGAVGGQRARVRGTVSVCDPSTAS